MVYLYTNRAAQGIAQFEYALALDRNLAAAHANIGLGKIFAGRAEEAEAHVEQALLLSPRDTMAYLWMNWAGSGNNHRGRYEKAISWFRRSIEANRTFPHPHIVLGAALAAVGRLDEARWATLAGIALNPSLSISFCRASWRAVSDNPTYLAGLELNLELMRRAGLPE